MEIFRNLDAIPRHHYPVVAFGNFDGVHLGHRAVLRAAMDRARAAGGTSFALTFDPLPILETIRIPLLAMNGELDEEVPTKASVPILERALHKAGNRDFTMIVLPKAGHNFMQTDRPYGAEEFVRKKEYVPGYWDTVADWLRKQLNLKSPY